ncbi:response regulator transcription factor [Flammeovirga kamogawensis]|uniref:Response regulator transcription factor n=1 Tax=Flammeovirga kamogawensis TaxID=373891 RepID=A0ABX8GQ21_9BACT|nr:response regulator transcription factor [Flammeovirga kamogawensis]MBB6463048.1 DNA-binding NarL/FixJ family response regulator [Flammeovirga kamogawensis]QWG05685.1 response regulator transcription factor [Flammeovirga kamogawensis]TRX67514.1 response regulator transcription factor [Flammeovirga kamogawensis]
MNTPIKVLLVDDHNMIREGLKSFLDKEHFDIIGEAVNGVEALLLLEKHKVDVVITDIMMPEKDGITLCKEITAQYPSIHVLALTMMNESYNIKKMLNAGAKGYILKDCTQDELRKAITSVAAGENYYSSEVTSIIMQGLSSQPAVKKRVLTEIPLTEREMEVLHLICKEFSNIEIGEKLFISPRTVETHKRNLVEKTGAKNVAGLVLYAIERNLFTDL